MSTATPVADDPYLWLEALDSDEALKWVAARNAETVQAYCDAQFETDRAALLNILNADDRIPWIARRGAHVYNFWQDARHPKGLWRRTTLDSYRADAPVWDVMLDLDALAKAENEDWVWHGCTAFPPHYARGLISLSRGGADAAVIREFDLEAKRFVADGFVLDEAKGSAAWLNENQLFVSSSIGGTAFETASGYPRTVRLWSRGTPISEAPVVFEGAQEHMWIAGLRDLDPQGNRTLFVRRIDFVNSEMFVEGPDGLRLIPVPADCAAQVHRDWLIVTLRSSWDTGDHVYPAGALLVMGFESFMAGDRTFSVLFEPAKGRFLQDFVVSGDTIALSLLDHVRSRIMFARSDAGVWKVEALSGAPEQAVLSIGALDHDFSDGFQKGADTFVLSANNAISSASLSLVSAGQPPALLKQMPARFDADGLEITQHHAVADDGTRIPYFQIAPQGLKRDGSTPVLLSGYGGFQISSLPHYSASVGRLWLARGGVYVIANIRGGGEFGPDWHKAGMREGKKTSHDDFAAVARDLIAQKVTRAKTLACIGGSNGGLLTGNMLTRYPELFGAIVCAVPLLDMQRYTKLPPGPSWVAEYGDPDKPEDWAFLSRISAYQLVEEGRKYPPILITTSHRDDRCHPGHARKMAAKLVALGKPVHFHEPAEGGHAGAADNTHLAYNLALTYAFLRKTIGANSPAIAG